MVLFSQQDYEMSMFLMKPKPNYDITKEHPAGPTKRYTRCSNGEILELL